MFDFIITKTFNTFKTYPEIELACKNWKSLIKTKFQKKTFLNSKKGSI